MNEYFWRRPLLAVALVFSFYRTVKGGDTYSAVVVEYNPPSQPSVDAQTNILDNVAKYVEYIKLANSLVLPDIIVFPEASLKGYSNQGQYMEVPDPADQVLPCAHNTTYQAPLVQLSCAARATATYVVVNLSEQFYDSVTNSTFYFNTDVAFDLNGVIVARYRKINLYNEGKKSPSINKEMVYFDTEFGVRFGLFTCFDIIFEDPGIYLAQLYNVSHFIFPTAWFSEMPFLTAIQEQRYWSYTLDAVLLASGYNDPSVGSSGTGVYLGRLSSPVYNMTQTTGSFMLHATVPKDIRSASSTNVTITTRRIDFENATSVESLSSSSGIKLKRDHLDVYSTVLITIPDTPTLVLNGTTVNVPFSMEETICQNTLCCNFSVNVTIVFSNSGEIVTRGDDYSQLYYRLAVFDGVRNYDGAGTGGLQTCAIIPCVNSNLSSCGLRSDNGSAQPNTFLDNLQVGFVFESITISGNFSNNNSFVGPNVLLGGQNDEYGSLMSSDSFVFSTNNVTNETTVNVFQTTLPVQNLVTASVYGRLFNRDGETYTGYVASESSSSQLFSYSINIVLLLTAIILIKYSI